MKEIIAAIFCIVGFGWCAYVVASTPIVQFEHRTGRCVGVIPPSAGSCKVLPAKYEYETVAEGYEPNL